jgi:hypothetical protein
MRPNPRSEYDGRESGIERERIYGGGLRFLQFPVPYSLSPPGLSGTERPA